MERRAFYLALVMVMLSISSCSVKSTQNNDLFANPSSNVDAVSGISLIDPAFSPAADPTPLISVSGVESGNTISVYSDSSCSALIASEVSAGSSVQVAIPTLTLGTHRFYAKQTRPSDSAESACSSVSLEYILSGISVTGVSDDLVPEQSKDFSWSCAGAATCDYRFVVNTNASHSFSSETYGPTTSLTQSTGTGDFYLHIQARDSSNTSVESGVYSYQFKLDNAGPIVSSNLIAADTYGVGETIRLSVTFDEVALVSGVPRILLNFQAESASPIYANYVEGSGTTTLVFEYTVASGDQDADNIASAAVINSNGGAITDSLGNVSDYSLLTQAYPGALVDGIAPSVSSVAIAPDSYNLGEAILVSVNFSENVYVTGSPRIQLSFESQSTSPLFANYLSGSGSSTLVFRYVVASGDFDVNGINLASALSLNGGAIADLASNPAGLTLSSTSFPTVTVDSAAPYITSFIEPAAGTYADGGGQLLFQVNFSEAVNITGSPRIAINLGGSIVYATYLTGSGSSGLEFSYAIQSGDADSDGITLTSTSIDLNGGTILSASDGDPSALEFGSYLDSMSGVLVDTSGSITAPNQVTGVTTAPTTNNSELRVSWIAANGNGTPIVNYSVQYREQGTSTWNTLSPSPITNTAIIGGLTAGVTYEIRVAANNGLLGPYSAVSTAQIFDVLLLNPIAWLSATDISNGGAEPLHDQKISSWEDLTGAASPATEANPANQPVYKTNVQNGLPAVRFDELAQGLQGTFTRSVGTNLTFIVVGQFDTGSTDRCLFEFNQGSSARGFFIDRRYGSNTNYSPALTRGSFKLWRIEDTGPTAKVTEGKTTTLFSGATMFNTDFTGVGSYTLGDDATGGNRLNGYIGEFLIFDRALTPAEIETLENYLINKWGL